MTKKTKAKAPTAKDAVELSEEALDQAPGGADGVRFKAGSELSQQTSQQGYVGHVTLLR